METKRILQISNELRYRSLPDLIGQEISIRYLDSIASNLNELLVNIFPDELTLITPKRSLVTAKYGVLKLNFRMLYVELKAPYRYGVSLVRELGFLPPHEEIPGLEVREVVNSWKALESETTKNQIYLSLFLQRKFAFRLKYLLKRKSLTIEIKWRDQHFNRFIFPHKFIIKDACLTNARIVWFYKHY